MTRLPQVVEPTTTLATARQVMDEHGIHHLPVVDGGRLCGMVREHDLAFLENRPEVDATKTKVTDAMTADVYAVEPSCSLGEVFGTMADHRYDAVVVVRDGAVEGIVTTVDAMHVLARLLGANTSELAPSQVRARVLAEHERLLGMLEPIEALSKRVLSGETQDPRLRSWAKDLYAFLKAHLRLENDILVPALAETPGFGKARAAALEAEHREQEAVFERVLGRLARKASLENLATELLELSRSLRDDIAQEQQEFLSAELLRDDVMPSDTFGG